MVHKKRADTAAIGSSMDREAVLQKLSDMLIEMYAKVMQGRVRDKQAFTTKVSALKAFSYGVSIYAGVLKDKDLDTINSRLEILEHPEDEALNE